MPRSREMQGSAREKEQPGARLGASMCILHGTSKSLLNDVGRKPAMQSMGVVLFGRCYEVCLVGLNVCLHHAVIAGWNLP